MARPLVVLHGWSDNASSFLHLAKELEANLGQSVESLHLGDFLTLDDEVLYDDLVAGLDRAWKAKDLPTKHRSVDLVCHSTGALIIRDWLTRRFDDKATPFYHLVMLAPANFGSPIAHQGHAWYGRVMTTYSKGYDPSRPFQTGREILDGLELASAYTWELAQRDRFTSKRYYGLERTLCTVLVGDTGYSGGSAAANKPGTDGTVRLSTANMNCAKIELNIPDYEGAAVPDTLALPNLRTSTGTTAFGILAGENHSTIAGKEDGFRNPKTLDYIIKALKVTNTTFPGWCKQLEKANAQLRETFKKKAVEEAEGFFASWKPRIWRHLNRKAYQNTLTRVRDHDGNPVTDYFIEFYEDKGDTKNVAEIFQQQLIRNVHAYGRNPAYRSLLIDTTSLHERIDADWEEIKTSLTAYPDIKVTKSVGFSTFDWSDIPGFTLTRDQVRKVFVGDRTLLVDITIPRTQTPDVFQLLTPDQVPRP